MNICDAKKCTGCMACFNVCNHHAVDEVSDILGKTTYQINKDKCINCNLCKKTCPVNQPVTFHAPKKAYAAWSNHQSDVALSSSGGIASVFSRHVIQEKGVVFGASVKDKIAQHIVAECEKDVDLLRGSKYVQSKISYTFREIKQRLKDDKTVLFVGTPCQVAGLHAYLGKDYTNLVAVDLICHGTPPMQYLQEHLDTVCGKNEWKSFSFRGQYDYKLTAYNDNIIYQKDKNEDEYFLAFIDTLIFRDNCYTCTYSQINRVSDITVGDFWGLKRSTLKTPYTGKVSVVLINTPKGQGFFDICKDSLVWEERDVLEAKNKHQHNLNSPSVEHSDRALFEREYQKVGFTKAVRKTGVGKAILMKKTFVFKILRKIKKAISH